MSAEAAPAEPAPTWAEDRIAHDREATRAIAWIAFFLSLVWVLQDVVLEPALLVSFAAARLATAAVLLMVAIGTRHAKTRQRILFLTTIGAAGPIGMAIFMVPQAVHFWAYLVGFAILPLGVGTLLAWPLREALPFFLAITGGMIASTLGRSSLASGEALSGSVFSCALSVVGCVSCVLRHRMRHQTWCSARALHERNRDLASALESLEQAQGELREAEKLAALGRLLAGLSHEINNPLNVICNNVAPLSRYLQTMSATLGELRDSPRAEQLWQRNELEFVRTDAADALDCVASAAERIRGINRDLRGFIRGDAAAGTSTNLNDCVRSTVQLLARNLPPTVQLRAEYGELPSLVLRAGPIGQVLFNLLSNAVLAVGGAGTVSVRTGTSSSRAWVAVKDDGPGVPKELRSRLFEPFFTTRPGRGTGLGLATSYQIVEDHGGRLFLDEEAGAGACFVVELPLAGPQNGSTALAAASIR